LEQVVRDLQAQLAALRGKTPRPGAATRRKARK